MSQESKKGGKIVPVNKDVELMSVDNIIAKLFRKILFDLGANDYTRFSSLLEIYVRNYGSTDFENLKDRSSERNNLRKELLKDRITFKVFATKALRFLGIGMFDLSITLYHPNGRQTVHTISRIRFTDLRANEFTGTSPEQDEQDEE